MYLFLQSDILVRQVECFFLQLRILRPLAAEFTVSTIIAVSVIAAAYGTQRGISVFFFFAALRFTVIFARDRIQLYLTK